MSHCEFVGPLLFWRENITFNEKQTYFFFSSVKGTQDGVHAKSRVKAHLNETSIIRLENWKDVKEDHQCTGSGEARRGLMENGFPRK